MRTPRSYSDELKHPLWQRKRLEVFAAADFSCKKCRSTEKQLQVHHHRYHFGRKPWEYPLSEFSCLCAECHKGVGLKLIALRQCLLRVLLPGKYAPYKNSDQTQDWAWTKIHVDFQFCRDETEAIDLFNSLALGDDGTVECLVELFFLRGRSAGCELLRINQELRQAQRFLERTKELQQTLWQEVLTKDKNASR